MVTQQATVLQLYAAAWLKPDAATLASYYDGAGVYEDAGLGVRCEGKAAIREFLASMLQAFPDTKVEVIFTFEADGFAAAEWTMTGTQTGDLPGLPATGRSFLVRGASIVEFAGDLIRRNTDYWDQASMLRQLGVLPEA